MPRLDPKYPRDRRTWPRIPEGVSPLLRDYLNGLTRAIQDVEQEYLVGCRMGLSAAQSIPDDATLHDVEFDQIVYDGGDTADVANGRIYARVAGVWHFDATVCFDVNATSYRMLQILHSDGTFAAGQHADGIASVRTVLSASCDVYLDKDDYMVVAVLQNSGGALDVLEDISFFNGRLCEPLRE